MDDQKIQLIAGIQSNCNKILELKYANEIPQELLKFNGLDASDIIDFWRQVNNFPLDKFKTNQLQSLNDTSADSFMILKVWENSLAPGELPENIQSRSDALSNHLNFIQRLNIYAIVISYSMLSQSDAVQRIQENVAETTRLKEEAENNVQSIDKGIEVVQQTNAGVYNETYAKFFEDEAKTHSDTSWGWFGGALVCGGLLAFYFFYYLSPAIAAKLTIPEVLARLSIVSVISYVLVVCLRNQAAHRHNQVLNRLRLNIIKTYEALIQSAPDDAKSVILQQVTASLYAPQDTGFNGRERDSGSVINIGDIAKSFDKK